MIRTKDGPPSRMREKGKLEWFRRYKVQCDNCSNPAEYRWRKRNLCGECLNNPYENVTVGEGKHERPYLSEVRTLIISSRSSANTWKDF